MRVELLLLRRAPANRRPMAQDIRGTCSDSPRKQAHRRRRAFSNPANIAVLEQDRTARRTRRSRRSRRLYAEQRRVGSRFAAARSSPPVVQSAMRARQRANGRRHGGNDRADDAGRQRKLGDGLALLFDHDPADVAFVHQSAQLRQNRAPSCLPASARTCVHMVPRCR